MPKTRDPASQIASLAYEDAVRELDTLVETMEAGQMPLEASLDAYRRGSLLLRHCQQQLADAEERLRVLEGEHLVALALDPDPRS
jgi:exodeoxyribonuclease VII small subunit